MIRLKDEITYWTVAANDGTGGLTFDAGIKVPAAVSFKDNVVISADGKQIVTRYAIYCNIVIPEKSFIYIGDNAGAASPHQDARQVVANSHVPSMTSLARMLI